ncbi:MAG: helix-turn-helix domain-containing protein [Nitrospirota bacterium]
MDSRDKLALHRFQYIEKIKNRPKDMSVIDACKGIGVSFPTYYKWLRRLTSAGNRVDSLYDRRPSGKRHYKSLNPEQDNAIVEVIVKHPEFGSQKISEALPKKADGKPLVSNGGVQNFLERRGLNRMKARINFAEEYSKTIRRQSEREKTQDNKNYMKEAISLGRV